MCESVELRKICNIQSGGTPSRSNNLFYNNGTIKWAKISDLERAGDGFIYDTEEYISEQGLKDINNRIFKKNTLFLAMYGSVGKTAITKTQMSCNQAILGITPKDPKVIDLNFLKYWFDSIKEQLMNSARGVALKNLSAGMVKALQIPLPPLKTQQRIVAILDNAAALRDKTAHLLKEYDLLAQSIFLDMFGDPVRNPMGWPISTIKKVCITILGGGTPRKSNEDYYNGDIPWVTPKDMKKLYISKSKINITQKGVDESSVKLIPKNSILMVIRSGILKKKLPVALNTSEVTINQDMKAFLANDKVINPKYLMFFFLNSQGYLLSKVRAVTADNIEFNQIKNMKIPLPELSFQNQFAEKIALIEQQKELAKQELKQSEDLFNCLLQKAFKGELVGEEVEDEVEVETRK